MSFLHFTEKGNQAEQNPNRNSPAIETEAMFSVKSSSTTTDGTQSTRPNESAFNLPRQMTPIKEVVRKSRSVPGQGGVVYDSRRQPVKLRDEFLSNPQSVTYQTDLRGTQAKIYQAAYLRVSYFEDKVKR